LLDTGVGQELFYALAQSQRFEAAIWSCAGSLPTFHFLASLFTRLQTTDKAINLAFGIYDTLLAGEVRMT
jgi:hypothetical protein